MIISVASGKGGTGKTTISTNLARSIGQQNNAKGIQVLDCDIEEPNAHLFLNPDIIETRKVNAPVPQIDLDKCTFCRKCMDICRFGAIAVLKKDVMTFENLCHSCGGCFEICPENAVVEKERSLGCVESGTALDIKFTNGKLDIGQVMVPPIIRQVRAETDPEMVTIIDAPPGTSCPVIAAMNGADFILLVTEPTPFGLHDLKLAVETAKILNIPHGIVINRAGMGDGSVNTYAKQENIPVLMEIPFDKSIAKVYSNGGMIVDEIDGYREKFSALYEKIELIVNKQGPKQ